MRAALALAGALVAVVVVVAPAQAAAPQPGQASPCGTATCPDPTPQAPPPAPPGGIRGTAGQTATATDSGAPAGSCSSGGILGSITHAFDPWCWIDQAIADAVRPVFEAFGSFAFSTPDILGNASVRKMALALLGLSDVCLIIIVLYRAHRVTWGGLVAQGRAKHGLDRLIVGVLLANFCLLVLVPIADIANALAKALLAFGGDNIEVRVQSLIPTMVMAAANPLMILLMLFVVVAGILVVFWSLVRWIVLAMVIALGAPSNLAVAVDQDQLTRAWWRCVLTLLFVPVLQVIAYDMGIWLFFSINPIQGASAVMDGLALLVLIWALYEIPKHALRSTAAPLMAAYSRAKRATLGVAALGVFAATAGLGAGAVAGVGARGFSVHGLLRGLIGRSSRKRTTARRPATRPTRRPQPIRVESERIP
jgi:hypothetical protein